MYRKFRQKKLPMHGASGVGVQTGESLFEVGYQEVVKKLAEQFAA